MKRQFSISNYSSPLGSGRWGGEFRWVSTREHTGDRAGDSSGNISKDGGKVWQNAGLRTSDITTSLGICSSQWQGLYVVIYWGLWKMVWNKWHSLLKQNCPCKCAARVPCVPGRSREHKLTFSVAETSQSHVLSAEPRRKWPHFWLSDMSEVQKSLSRSSVETQSKIGGENFFSSEISIFGCRFLCWPSEILTRMSCQQELHHISFSPSGPVLLGLYSSSRLHQGRGTTAAPRQGMLQCNVRAAVYPTR